MNGITQMKQQEQALQLPAWITNSDEDEPEGFGLTVAGE
jgi:hypothetical protein